MEKLTGLYKFMMRVMAKTVGKRVAAKPDPTPEERDMLELLEKGGSRVSRDHLSQVLAWYRGESPLQKCRGEENRRTGLHGQTGDDGLP